MSYANINLSYFNFLGLVLELNLGRWANSLECGASFL
jgi:hypothetical protein